MHNLWIMMLIMPSEPAHCREQKAKICLLFVAKIQAVGVECVLLSGYMDDGLCMPCLVLTQVFPR